jgi:hypothetical protein
MKKILCIFTENEGSSALDSYLSRHKDIYRPAYEILDEYHQTNLDIFKINEPDYFMALFGYKTRFKSFKLREKNLGGCFNYDIDKYMKTVSNYKYIYFKYRMPPNLYYLIEKADINYIILPIRYDFERILGMYLKKFHATEYNKISQFTRYEENNNDIKDKNYIKININDFNIVYNLQCECLKQFKIKYNLLREYTSKIIIFEYSKFSDNNLEYLKNIYNKLNIDYVEGMSSSFNKKNFNYIELFDYNSINIVNTLNNKYAIIYNDFDKYLRNLVD